MNSKNTIKLDPLEGLRNYYKIGKSAKLKDKYLIFDKEKLPLNTETAWVSTITGKQYNLGSLWLFLES